MRKPAAEARPAEVDPRFAPVVDAFAGDPDVSAGTMMASFGLKVRGKIFAMVARGRLVVKLPRSRVDELVAAGAGERFDPGHGRVMKEWISIEGDDGWSELAREAHRFVGAGTA
jgi:TfoX/Sxy family transcriptional regulator of competence genes